VRPEDEDRKRRADAFLQLLYDNACPYEDSKNRNRERVVGTCNWFTTHDLFKLWNSPTESALNSSNLLLVTADPGCGKSVLSRYLVDKILPDNARTVCYFFFKDDFEDQKNLMQALCTILHQLFSRNRNLLSDAVLEKHGSLGKRFVESFAELWSTFMGAASLQETVCVIDALDECRELDRNKLIEAVTTVNDRSNRSQRIKFLVTSRPYEHIRRQFYRRLGSHMPSIHLQGDHGPTADEIVQEIQCVVDSRIEEIANLFSLESDERQLLKSQLETVQNRTYLWITLVFDGLLDSPLGLDKSDILAVTQMLPQSVDDAYEKILSRNPDLNNLRRRALHIILGAERPMSLVEMSMALAFQELDDEPSCTLSKNRIIPMSRIRTYLRDLCGLFVTIVDDNVYLLHQTAREFLLRTTVKGATIIQAVDNPIRKSQEDRWKHSIALEDSNSVLLKICISYLHGQVAKQNPALLEYSAIYWPSHYRQSGRNCQAAVAKVALDICQPYVCTQWTDIYDIHNDVPATGFPISLAAALGIDGAVEVFLREQLLSSLKLGEVDLKDDKYGRTPLSWAARAGHEAVVQLLLGTGQVDVNAKSTDGWTPLSYAAKRGHEAVVQLLLGTGQVDVNAKSTDGWTPLLYAAERGHEAVVRLLLGTDQVDVNAKNKYGRTPLSYAADAGHEAVVQLLLGTDQVDVNAKNKNGRTPLSCAADAGHEAVVQLLLGTDQVDVNAKNNGGWTPLLYAAYAGHEAVVQLLLGTGQVDVNAKNKNGRTPLLYAADAGHEAVVQLLLGTDQVDVNAKNNGGRTPLLYAAYAGHEAVVQLLLGTDQVDVNAKNNGGWTPLSYAAERGHEAVVQLLLGTGQVDVNAQDYLGRTALSCAAEGGHEAVVQLLLGTGQVDVNAEDYLGRTPLLYAAGRGHEAVVQLLLGTGQVDVNAQDYLGRTPPSWAAEGGHEAVVQLLLSTGQVDVDAEDEDGRTPLSWAAGRGHEAVVQLLDISRST
jgi:ankyrin repeat protein